MGDDEDSYGEFAIPADAAPGTYQVRAMSAGGEAFAADLTTETGAIGGESAAVAEPSSEPMQLDRRRSGGELVAAVAGLLASVGLGLVLVRVKTQ